MGFSHGVKFQKQKDLFDGTIECGVPPKPSSIDEILHQLKDLENLVLTKAPHMKAKISHEKRGVIGTRKVYSFNFHIGVYYATIWM